MVRAVLTFLAQALPNNDPIPSGWWAVGGALGLTVFTIAALRRLQRWSITDLEAALARQRQEVALARAELDAERRVSADLRARWTAAEDEKRGLRIANVQLNADNQALQTEITRLHGLLRGDAHHG